MFTFPPEPSPTIMDYHGYHELPVANQLRNMKATTLATQSFELAGRFHATLLDAVYTTNKESDTNKENFRDCVAPETFGGPA